MIPAAAQLGNVPCAFLPILLVCSLWAPGCHGTPPPAAPEIKLIPLPPAAADPHFLMGATEVTRSQWQAVMGTQPWRATDDFRLTTVGDDLPATNVSAADAREFCRRLTDRAAGVTGIAGRQREVLGAFRLPTNAELQWAATCGQNDTGAWNATVVTLADQEWLDASEGLHSVATKSANPWGLYDAIGNAAELTFDPRAPESLTWLTGRAFPDGSCALIWELAMQSHKIPTGGFRVVREIAAPAPARPARPTAGDAAEDSPP